MEQVARNLTDPTSRNLFELYDQLKNIAHLTILISLVLVAKCKIGKCLLWKQESKHAHKMARKTVVCFLIFLVLYCFSKMEGKAFMKTWKNVKMEKFKNAPVPAEVEDGEKFDVEDYADESEQDEEDEEYGRNLGEKHGHYFK